MFILRSKRKRQGPNCRSRSPSGVASERLASRRLASRRLAGVGKAGLEDGGLEGAGIEDCGIKEAGLEEANLEKAWLGGGWRNPALGNYFRPDPSTTHVYHVGGTHETAVTIQRLRLRAASDVGHAREISANRHRFLFSLWCLRLGGLRRPPGQRPHRSAPCSGGERPEKDAHGE